MDDNKTIAVNSIIIFVRLVVTTVISVYASRIVLDALGASDYGLYNVVGGIVTMLNVINSAMLSTTYRYLAFEIGKVSEGSPNKVFNICISIHAIFALLLLVVGLFVGLWYVNNYLNIPDGKLDDARFVLVISCITTAVSTVFVPFHGLQVAYEKFAINATIDIVSHLIRIGALLLFVYTGNRIRTYTLIMMVYILFSSFMYFAYCFIKYEDVIRLKIYKDYTLVKQMLSYAVWTLFGAVANMAKNQGSAIIINFFYGTVVNAAFAIANQVEGFILMFAKSLSNAAIPQITKNFSGGNKGRSTTLTCYISKYTFLLMSMVAFPVLMEMDFLLGLWLKEIPAGATIFCKLVVLGGLLDCLGAGIPALVNATGNIRNYQVIVHTFTLLGLPISFVLYKLGYTEYTISVVFCAIIFLSAFLKLFLLKRIFKFNVLNFIQISYTRMFVVSLPLAIAYFYYSPANYSVGGHFLGLVLSELFVIACILILGFDRRERCLIKEYMRPFFKRLKQKKEI